jgi:hypothetical protein
VGVVTALEMALYPVRDLYAGALFFPIERPSEVLRAWREWTDAVPGGRAVATDRIGALVTRGRRSRC